MNIINKEKFEYETAFYRNLGWLTKNEQQKIKQTTIAIPGMGGVGGHHLHALLRLGFERFHIADMDDFDIGNFNRQFGATMSSCGRSKVQVLKEIAQDINPNVEIKEFSTGIQKNNMNEFLKNVDIVVDGLDLYASELRSPLYELAHQNGQYVLSAGPFGMGTSIMVFHPEKMSFNEYFDMNQKGLTKEALVIRFLAGMSPKLLHRKYVQSAEHVQLFNGNLPSLHTGCYSASAALSAAVLKIVLQRGKVLYAPWGQHTDFYLNTMKTFWRPFGNRNPLQKILIKVMHRMFEVQEFN